jgi:hypothetical protein
MFISVSQAYALVLESYTSGNSRCFSLSCVWWNDNNESGTGTNDTTNADGYNSGYCNDDSDGCHGKDR